MYKPQEPKEGPKRLSEPAEDDPEKFAKGGYISGARVELDAAEIQNPAQSVLNQKAYLK